MVIAALVVASLIVSWNLGRVHIQVTKDDPPTRCPTCQREFPTTWFNSQRKCLACSALVCPDCFSRGLCPKEHTRLTPGQITAIEHWYVIAKIIYSIGLSFVTLGVPLLKDILFHDYGTWVKILYTTIMAAIHLTGMVISVAILHRRFRKIASKNSSKPEKPVAAAS